MYIYIYIKEVGLVLQEGIITEITASMCRHEGLVAALGQQVRRK